MSGITGRAATESGILTRQEYEYISLARPRSRIGIYLSEGIGMEKILIGYNEDNDELYLSTGGGTCVSAEYGLEVRKFLDLSFNWFYQGSFLTPPVKNANVSFTRMCLLATPSLIIPVKRSDYMKFRVGGGTGFYWLGTMKVDLTEAGGESFVLKYKPTVGVHGSFLFEPYFSERSSFALGLRYYHLYYTYTSSGSTGMSTDPRVNNPKGSGLDFFCGYYYHF